MRARRLLLTLSGSLLIATALVTTSPDRGALASPTAAGDAASGSGDGGPRTRRLHAYGTPDAASFAISTTPADPDPLVSEQDWIYDLRYDRGDIYLVEVRRTQRHAARTTPRVMGRFAIELFSGPTLIERVRFDFPLLGADDGLVDAGSMQAPRFSSMLRTGIGVIFPRTDKGNRLELLDRKTGTRWDLPWPPEDPQAHDR